VPFFLEFAITKQKAFAGRHSKFQAFGHSISDEDKIFCLSPVLVRKLNSDLTAINQTGVEAFMISTIRNALHMASQDIAIITNNIANAGSTGFKRSDSHFLDSYAEDPPIRGRNVGFGALAEEPRRQDNKQGALKVTNAALDVAVSGVGMFITTSEVEGDVTFTRDGSFLLDIAGNVTTTDGRGVIGIDGQPLAIPPEHVNARGESGLIETIDINERGQIQVTYGNGSIIDRGAIALADFPNIGGLRTIGGGHFKATEKSGPPFVALPMEGNFGKLFSGHLEASNTNITNELTKLMKAQQAYSGSARLMQSAAEMTKSLMR
jgi:flagellar basal-body rod protein FlgG